MYLAAALCMGICFAHERQSNTMEYRTEINDLLVRMQQGSRIQELPLASCVYVQDVSFLPKEEVQSAEQNTFFADRSGQHTAIKPLYVGGEWKGYLCFSYILPHKGYTGMMCQILLFLFFALLITVLLYVRGKVLIPFTRLQDMPYELAKGHLRDELPESREKYFGKFLWGLSMLRDSLQSARMRELQLLQEKKTLILSISHDIKIPVSAIKLYARGIYEGMAESQEERENYGHRIEQHADEIEQFVSEMMSAASEELLSLEVEQGEFYLKDYVNRIEEIYAPKCALRMIELHVGNYVNRMLRGDSERAIEVMENLMENAIKYGDGRRIEISFSEEEYCQVIEVFNTGEPVRANELPHLFNSFFRGSNVEGRNGNGLGLYISRQLMLKMDGELYVQSREDGMSFCMVFEEA